MVYKYETHLHTSQSSACAESTGAEMVDYYKSIGYSGFVVTDHFINGNTSVNADIPWTEKVDAFCVGYEDAKKRGDEIGFKVFFGFEFNYKGTEFLIYGLDKDWLKRNELITKSSLRKALQIIRDGGGMIIHAHPFRIAHYIQVMRFAHDLTDAVEIKNGGNNIIRSDNLKINRQDELAEMYAEMLGKPMISGGDNHSANPAAGLTAGISTDFPINTVSKLIETIKKEKYTMIWEE